MHLGSFGSMRKSKGKFLLLKITKTNDPAKAVLRGKFMACHALAVAAERLKSKRNKDLS